MYIGGASAVSSTSGYKIAAGASFSTSSNHEASAGPVYAISTGASVTVCVIEFV